MRAHAAVAAKAYGDGGEDPGKVAAALDDPSTAPLDDKVRATLAFLRKMTLEPQALGPEDARAVLATGVTKSALRDAIHVAYLFNLYDRLADSMDWDVPDGDGAYRSAANNLLSKRGYR